jgi:hypothetical protein|tara:strand:- start:347 stop:556 length:210 start_codon:yes stop_codon:yes gene_type:complete
MCLSRPKIQAPPPPPIVPPIQEPSEVAEVVENKADKTRRMKKRRGNSSLTIRRPSVSSPSSGAGANINY